MARGSSSSESISLQGCFPVLNPGPGCRNPKDAHNHRQALTVTGSSRSDLNWGGCACWCCICVPSASALDVSMFPACLPACGMYLRSPCRWNLCKDVFHLNKEKELLTCVIFHLPATCVFLNFWVLITEPRKSHRLCLLGEGCCVCLLLYYGVCQIHSHIHSDRQEKSSDGTR